MAHLTSPPRHPHGTGATVTPPAELEALRLHVSRIVATEGALGEAVDGLQRPVAFTDGFTVLCADALDAAVEAESNKPSGNLQFKFLAWLVGDALGAAHPWDAAIAMRVGKRLQKRISGVREMIADLRQAVRDAEAGGDADGAAAARKALDEALAAPCPTKLDELLLPGSAPPAVSEAADAVDAADTADAVDARATQLYPQLFSDEPPKLSDDLVDGVLLGEAGAREVQELALKRRRWKRGEMEDERLWPQGDEWWLQPELGEDAGTSFFFPVIRHLAWRVDEQARALASAQEDCERKVRMAVLQASLEEPPEVAQLREELRSVTESRDAWRDAKEEVDRELQLSEGRVDGLLEVIRRQTGGARCTRPPRPWDSPARGTFCGSRSRRGRRCEQSVHSAFKS